MNGKLYAAIREFFDEKAQCERNKSRILLNLIRKSSATRHEDKKRETYS